MPLLAYCGYFATAHGLTSPIMTCYTLLKRAEKRVREEKLLPKNHLVYLGSGKRYNGGANAKYLVNPVHI